MQTSIISPSDGVESPHVHKRMRSQISLMKNNTPLSPLIPTLKTDKFDDEIPDEKTEKSQFFKNLISEIDLSLSNKQDSQVLLDSLSSKYSEIDIFRISNEQFSVTEGKIHILNFYALPRRYEIIKLLLKLYDQYRIPLSLHKDYYDLDVLEISIRMKDYNMAQTLVDYLIKYPPAMEKLKLTKNTLMGLFALGIKNIDKLLDSRIFVLKPYDLNCLYSSQFKNSKYLVVEDPDPESINYKKLVKLNDKSDDNISYLVEVKIIDIENLLGENNKENALQEFKEFLISIRKTFVSGDEIYQSEVIEEMVNFLWHVHAKQAFIVNFTWVIVKSCLLYVLGYVLNSINNGIYWKKVDIFFLLSWYLFIWFDFNTEYQEFKTIKSLPIYLSIKENIIDLLYLITLTIFVSMLLAMEISGLNEHNSQLFYDILLMDRSIFNFLLCLKIFIMLEISIQIGFYIRLIVFTMKYVLIFYLCFFILILAVSVGIAGSMHSEHSDDAAKSYAEVFLYTYKVSMGDFDDFLDINNGSYTQIVVYVYFFFGTGILSILMLNLLVTILGEGFAIMKSKERNYVNQVTLASITSILLTKSVISYQQNKQNAFLRLILNNFLYGFRSTLRTHHQIHGRYLVFSKIKNTLNE